MKLLLSFILFAVISCSQLFSQCETAIYIQQIMMPSCDNAPLFFTSQVTTSCPNYTSVNYKWTMNTESSGGGMQELTPYTMMGTVNSVSEVPNYYYTGPFGSLSACLTITLLDAGGNILSDHIECASGIIFPMIMTSYVDVINDLCGNQSCVYATVVGGNPPYTYLFSDGSMASPNGYGCFYAPGTYTLTATDAMGCQSSISFDIQMASSVNAICEDAEVLQNGIVKEDTLCTPYTDQVSCSSSTYFQSGWYVINSENYSHLQIGMTTGYYPGTVLNNNNVIEVFEVPVGSDCSAGTLVHCGTASCFDLADEITISPNTNYYIHALAVWTTSAPVSIVAVLTDTSVATLCGCTNNLSCNYDPGAVLNDGSCGYNGCTDPGACNYLSYATCDDGTCVFGNDLSGSVFHDVNGNGVHDNYPVAEPMLANLGYIHINELDINLYPDGNGHFLLPDLPSGIYTINFVDENNIWSFNNGEAYSITLPTCNGLAIPTTPASGASMQLSGSSAFWNNRLHCTDGANEGVWIYNNGATNLSGSITIGFDPTLTLSPLSYSFNDYEIISPGVAVFTFTNLAPGGYGSFFFHVNGPGVEFVGQYFDFNFSVDILDGDNNPFYSNAWTVPAIVSCAYDPNDKSCNVEGYSEEHFILADTDLEYRIRFQNTGNAPAFNIVVEDQIDINAFDLSSFEPVGASHSYSTIVQPDGLVKFVFNQIMLPDSGSNEPESHGFVQYHIRPRQVLAPNTLLENTAHIFFDENPAIVTNTVQHTVTTCEELLPNPAIPAQDVCEGIQFDTSLNGPYQDVIQWYVDGNLLLEGPDFYYSSNDIATHEVYYTVSNALCAIENSFDLNIHDAPGDSVNVNGDVLTASPGSQYFWYFNDVLLQGQTSPTLVMTQTGTYQCVVVNEFNCNTTSQPIFFTGLQELSNQIALYPNPVSDVVRIQLPSGIYNIRLYDSNGHLIDNQRARQSSFEYDLTAYAAGMYKLVAVSNDGKIISSTLIKK